MSRVVEVSIPSCDVEILEAIAYLRGMPFDRTFQAAMLAGAWWLSQTAPTEIDTDMMQRWCDEAHTALSDVFQESTGTATWSGPDVRFGHE